MNLRLEIGQISERVVVEGYTQQLQTESSALGRVTSGDQVRDLPLVTRNYTQIVSLNPVAADVNDAGAIGRGNLGQGGSPDRLQRGNAERQQRVDERQLSRIRAV